MARAAPFWMVCRMPVSEASKTEPRHRYRDRREAIVTAQRLADRHDHPFVVLEVAETIYPDKGFTQGLFGQP